MKDGNELFFVRLYNINEMIRNTEYRLKIAHLLANPYDQLDINLRNFLVGVFDASMIVPIDSVHSIHLMTSSLQFILASFKKIYSLNMTFKITQRYELKSIMDQLAQLNQLPLAEGGLGLRRLSLDSGGIRKDDLPFIPYLTSLKLTEILHCTSNLSQYRYLEELTLSHCKDFCDVSCLGDIPRLSLISCENIIDISDLNNNYKMIYIEDCEGIVDYSRSFRHSQKILLINIANSVKLNLLHYETVQELTLSFHSDDSRAYYTTGVFDSFPNHLRRLKISYYHDYFPTDPDHFHQLQRLSLVDCNKIIDASPFGGIADLELSLLRNLHSLNGLGAGNKTVEIDGCNGIDDFTPLRHIQRVIISACNCLLDVGHLDHVKYLKISSCKSALELSMLYRVYHLTLDFCERIQIFDGIRNIPIVEIISLCPVYKILESLGDNEKIILRGRYAEAKVLNNLLGIERIREHYLETFKPKQHSVIFLRQL